MTRQNPIRSGVCFACATYIQGIICVDTLHCTQRSGSCYDGFCTRGTLSVSLRRETVSQVTCKCISIHNAIQESGPRLPRRCRRPRPLELGPRGCGLILRLVVVGTPIWLRSTVYRVQYIYMLPQYLARRRGRVGSLIFVFVPLFGFFSTSLSTSHTRSGARAVGGWAGSRLLGPAARRLRRGAPRGGCLTCNLRRLTAGSFKLWKKIQRSE